MLTNFNKQFILIELAYLHQRMVDLREQAKDDFTTNELIFAASEVIWSVTQAIKQFKTKEDENN